LRIILVNLTRMPNKLTTKEFILKAEKVHGKKYEYQLSEYISSSSPINITCPIHGEFKQRPSKHLSGQGCNKCCDNSKKSINEYIIEFNTIHNNKYDYSIDDIKTAHSIINITCPIHGEFKQSINSHKNGNGCNKCYTNNRKTLDKFINEANTTHNKKYDYSLSEYVNNNTNLIIICPNHGKFIQKPRTHLSGCGCPTCNESKGEKMIRELLINRGINFIPQYKFSECKHVNELPFDFYLPNYNICIEYQGKQHFQPVEHFGGKEYFNLIVKRDKIKEEYCLLNNIQLIIVSTI